MMVIDALVVGHDLIVVSDLFVFVKPAESFDVV